MLSFTKYNWLAGTLELTSKVRYGLTSRGVPLFRFIPYDKRFPPLAVGCSQRNLFYNVHAVVLPNSEDPPKSELRKGTLIQNLEKPSIQSEIQLLLATYAYDSRKELRRFPAYPPLLLDANDADQRLTPRGLTFHIDPPGCKDVDDTFTLYYNGSFWEVAINIADVSAALPPNSPLDLHARELATSFYTPDGEAIQPMLPKEVSESILSLLPSDSFKQTVSLLFDFHPTSQDDKLKNIRWALTRTKTNTSYTYSQADVEFSPELAALRRIAEFLGASPDSTSHEWVAQMMIFYNKQAGELLSTTPHAILRRHAEAKSERISAILELAGVPHHLAYESAEYCLSSDPYTHHYGLSSNKYAYATSPIRRYADLVNQRALKAILTNQHPTPLSQSLIEQLNRREKQAKAFGRDYFFMSSLAQCESSPTVYGTVVESLAFGYKTKIWVPQWKRIITVKSLEPQTLKPGSAVSIQWYDSNEKPRWKERIVFRVSETSEKV